MRQDAALSDDIFDLKRFLDAQAPIVEKIFAELRDGRKRGHWMWFVFPQIAGLGASEIALKYAISSREEAQAFMAHPVLGERLVECVRAVLEWRDRPIEEIFFYPDDLKFRSSMTLFAAAAPQEPVFAEALDAFFEGAQDRRTLELVARAD